MLKHYARFEKNTLVQRSWGEDLGIVTEVIVLFSRDVEEAKMIAPNGCYAFRLFDINEVVCEDGEILFGERKNWSGDYYFGQGPFTKAQLIEMDEDYADEIKTWEAIHDTYESQKLWNREVWDYSTEPQKFPDAFVIAINGKIYPLYPEDTVIETELNPDSVF